MLVIFHFHKRLISHTTKSCMETNISVMQTRNKETCMIALIINTWTLRRRLQVRCSFSICSLLSNREVLTLSLLDCTDIICIGEKCEFLSKSLSSYFHFDSNHFNIVSTLRLPSQEAAPYSSPSPKCYFSSCLRSKY